MKVSRLALLDADEPAVAYRLFIELSPSEANRRRGDTGRRT